MTALFSYHSLKLLVFYWGKKRFVMTFNLKQLIINVITNLNKIRSCRFISEELRAEVWTLNQWNVSTHVTCFLLSRLQLSWATPNLPRLCKHWEQKSRKFFRCYFGLNDIFTNTFWNCLTFTNKLFVKVAFWFFQCIISVEVSSNKSKNVPFLTFHCSNKLFVLCQKRFLDHYNIFSHSKSEQFLKQNTWRFS